MPLGHAFSNDLKVLGIYHKNIIDTAIVTSKAVFPDRKPPRTWALRELTQKFMGVTIQAGQDGHSALEDARATWAVLLWCLEDQQRLRAWGVQTRRQFEGLAPLTSNSPDEGVQNVASTSVISSVAAHDSHFDDSRVRTNEDESGSDYASSTLHCQRGTDGIINKNEKRGLTPNNSTLDPEWTLDPDSVQTYMPDNGWLPDIQPIGGRPMRKFNLLIQKPKMIHPRPLAMVGRGYVPTLYGIVEKTVLSTAGLPSRQQVQLQ